VLPEVKLLFAERVRLLEELASLVERQEQLVELGLLDDLLGLLAAKDKVLAELEQLERKLAPLRTLEGNGETSSVGLPDIASLTMDRCRQLFREILERERICESKMRARREEIAQALANLLDLRRAHEAYQATQFGPENSGQLCSEV
jgi:flagellar biosynthesis/type III secretory pathway chaperone